MTVSFSTPYVSTVKACHQGQVLILPLAAGGLYAGGWSRDLEPEGFAVIDLTGTRYKGMTERVRARNAAGRAAFGRTLGEGEKPWLQFKIEDFRVPDVPDGFWPRLAEDVRALALSGEKVVIACTGGHGRTGTVVSILAALLAPELTGDDPVTWLRKRYCEHAVETHEQHRYVHKILELPEPVRTSYKHDSLLPKGGAASKQLPLDAIYPIGDDWWREPRPGSKTSPKEAVEAEEFDLPDPDFNQRLIDELVSSGIRYGDFVDDDGTEWVGVYEKGSPEQPLYVSDAHPGWDRFECVDDRGVTRTIRLDRLEVEADLGFAPEPEPVLASVAPAYDGHVRQAWLQHAAEVLSAQGVFLVRTFANDKLTGLSVRRDASPAPLKVQSVSASGDEVFVYEGNGSGLSRVAVKDLLQE